MSWRRPEIIHSYSPNFESNVPFCRDRSLRVNRGPISRKRTFSDDLKAYLRAKVQVYDPSDDKSGWGLVTYM